jgi:histidinol phosphatase-like PHP family hydrolase
MMKFFQEFKGIEKKYIYSDKHIHSAWGDGEATVSEIITKAEGLGLTQIAFTEHVRRDSMYFESYIEEISNAKKKSSVDILVGVEAKIADFLGNVDAPREVLKKCEIKIASVHRFPVGRKLYEPKQFKKKVCQEIELELSIAAIKKGECNVLGHAGGMSLTTYGDFPLDFFDEIVFECANHGIAFDLNYWYHHSIFRSLKEILGRHNPYVSIGSDAHTVKELGSWIDLLTREMIHA